MSGHERSDLEDRAEIHDLVVRYAHAVDDRDIDRLLEVFTDDVHFEFYGGEREANGHAEVRRLFEIFYEGPLLGRQGASTHAMTNTLIELDGDRAHVTTQAVAYLASDERDEIIVRGIAYIDVCRRTDSGWKIERRSHVPRWQGVLDRQPLPPPFFPADP